METYKEKVTWYDIVDPKPEDLAFLEKEFHLHPVIMTELRNPSQYLRVEFLEDYIYLVLHFPYFDEDKKTSRPFEVDIVATQNKVATVRYEAGGPMDEFALKCEGVAGFKSHCLGETSGEFIYRVCEYIFEYSLRELRHIEKKVEHIEEEIFKDRQKELIAEISFVKRDVLDFRRIILPIQTILNTLSSKGKKFYDENMTIYFEDLMGDYMRVLNSIDNFKETVESLETTNQALLSSRINEVMSLLSIMAFLFAPFTIGGLLFAIHSPYAPIIGLPYDWWIIFALMMAGSFTLFLWFKHKKWL